MAANFWTSTQLGRASSPGSRKVGILIVGAGPTGLGAATRLQQHGHADWLLVDQAPEPGGLSCTATTPEGFLFDMGGHVIFSHWAYFDQLLDAAVGAAAAAAADADADAEGAAGCWNTLQRVSYVWIRGRWVAYPFQNNIAALDKDDQVACLTGLIQARAEAASAGSSSSSSPSTFDEWIMRVMGRGIADMFMRPYNLKVWGVPPSQMQCRWLGERVATVDIDRAVSNTIHGREDAGWGPNAVFRFPKRGGTGGIWKAVARLLPADKQQYGAAVTAIDAQQRYADLSDGSRVHYDAMVSTVPLDVTLSMLGQQQWADGLQHSSSHIVGVGIRGTCPLGNKCWMYFPEDNCPFYRATVFSNYAAANTPPPSQLLPTLCLAGGGSAAAAGGGSSSSSGQAAAAAGPYWSLMFEVTESSCRPVDTTPVTLGGSTWPAVVRETLLGAVATQLLQPQDQVVSLFHRRLEHGYPTPSLGRDAVLEQALPWLQEAAGIWSRGRFGSYKYEVANQDHSLMLGVEAADNILFGSKELTLHHPDIVNAAKNQQPRYSPPGCSSASPSPSPSPSPSGKQQQQQQQ